MELPIDTVPGSKTPRFRWRQIVDTPTGKRLIEHEGALPASAEQAVGALIEMCKRLLMDNAGLQGLVEAHNRTTKLDTAKPAPQPLKKKA